MKKTSLPALCLLIGLCAIAGQSLAARRALVIGNDSYQKLQALRNAGEDARAIADKLSASGFDVTLRLDLNEKAMKAALRSFKNRIAGGDEAVFFYSGHGVQLGGANYLLPVDLAGDDEEQIKDEAIALQRVLDDLQEQKARFSLAIIDACRDNPFKGKGRSAATRGLAPTAAATGQMVMFSAGAGQQALDRLGDGDPQRNGVFTRVLLSELQKPGVSADRVLRNVRAEVVRLAKSVGHEQVPAIYDQAVGDFYFRRPAGAETVADAPVAVPTPAPASAPQDQLPAAANPDGKYGTLLQTLHCPNDRGTYGETHEYGYWSGGAWCGDQGKAGYWVWAAPNWYVWRLRK